MFVLSLWLAACLKAIHTDVLKTQVRPPLDISCTGALHRRTQAGRNRTGRCLLVTPVRPRGTTPNVDVRERTDQLIGDSDWVRKETALKLALLLVFRMK